MDIHIYDIIYILLLLLLFILTANVILAGGSGNVIRHNRQITHHVQHTNYNYNYN
jgi:hypothetical protein